MPSRTFLLSLAAAALAAVAAELAAPSADDARQHVISQCAGCHCLEYYITPRSRKAWELTVANMRVYTQHSANAISEADGERVTAYLATYFGERSTLDPIRHFALSPAAPLEPAPAPREAAPAPPPQPEPSAQAPLSAPPPPAPARLAPLVREDLPPALRARLAKHASRPQRPRALKRSAEASGYLAVACTLAMLASGHSRRSLGRRFRPLHVAAALGLFLSLAAHALIYLAQFGAPPVLWYWFGLASFLVLVLAQVQGLVRKRFGRVFLRVHVAAGYGGLALAVLHWIWAWL